MKTQKIELLKDVTFLMGIGLVILSLGIFWLPSLIHSNKTTDTFFGIFFLNYFISIIFFIVVWIREIPEFRLIHFQQKVEYGFIHLLLCLISAYSLNREIPVFEQSTDWQQLFLLFQGAILLLVFVQNRLAVWLQIIFWGMMGIIFSFFLYLSFYLVPTYPIGILASPAIGISLHAFVPLWFIIAIILYLVRKDNRKMENIAGFCIGIVVSIVFIIFYLIQWNQANNIITKASDKSLMDEKNDLPEWVVIAQNMPQESISEKILKTGLVYTMAPDKGDWAFFDMPSRNFDEIKKHDPFVMIATYFLGKPNLTKEQKIKILEAMYDSRHKAQERLWSGDDLQTSHILTNVRLYPNLHIAYTEKIISVRNNTPKRAWRREQEAIYTFHLPEGGVVTSLSLWINGKEEKAILTAKGKADTAYKSIVKVERRDPSLVRWHEGNTVSVRIFPCMPDEDRRFKIGFTAPLCKQNDKLFYENIWFDGPAPFLALESIKIQSMDNIDGIAIPTGFLEENYNTWTFTGKYQSDWNFNIPVMPIKPNAFSFDGNTYQISEYNKVFNSFEPEDIYLDINSQWSKSEFDLVRKLVSSKNVYVFQNQLIKVTDENANKLFKELIKLNFSVFPLYEIACPKKALFITKGTHASPNIADLGESDFIFKLKAFVMENEMLKVFNLNQELSPYLKTLKELRTFEYDFGSVDYLSGLINENKFIVNQENPETVAINDAGILIKETNDTSSLTNAPDHLMRLFSYNNVMFQTGTHYFEKDFFDQNIVDKAYKAYVVSPVTSLIVLETQEDYKRFGIKDEGKSLKNASMKSSGAVPEPHEWLLIIILASVAGYLFLKSRKRTRQISI